MNKRGYILLGTLIFLFLETVYISSAITAINPGHSSEQIYIKIGSNYINLQRALNSSSLGNITSFDSLPTSTSYHLASQILITTNNSYKMTLQEAIDNKTFLKGVNQSYTTTLPAGGEYAFSINISTPTGIMTLQNAINQNRLAHIYACVSNVGQSCIPQGTYATCVNSGKIQCDGTCNSTFKSAGIDCNARLIGSKCDGAGNCILSGTGCSACPFGVLASGAPVPFCGGITFVSCYANSGGISYNISIWDGSAWTDWYNADNFLCEIDWDLGRCGRDDSDYYQWQMKP